MSCHSFQQACKVWPSRRTHRVLSAEAQEPGRKKREDQEIRNSSKGNPASFPLPPPLPVFLCQFSILNHHSTNLQWMPTHVVSVSCHCHIWVETLSGRHVHSQSTLWGCHIQALGYIGPCLPWALGRLRGGSSTGHTSFLQTLGCVRVSHGLFWFCHLYLHPLLCLTLSFMVPSFLNMF